MKIWIIVLSILFVVLRLVRQAFINYIKNDKTERLKYYFTDGTSLLGIWVGLITIISDLVAVADLTLLLIYYL